METKKTFEFNSTRYKEFIRDFRSDDTPQHRLFVYAGIYSPNRSYAIEELKREIIGEAVEFDLAEIVTDYEEESYANIDSTIEKIDGSSPLVIFRNAEQLCGVYTAYTSSVVKYATPQEKYFLKKIKKLNCTVLLELKSIDHLDRTMVRNADAVVLFKEPSSLLEKLAWKFKNIHVHGSRLPSSRPI